MAIELNEKARIFNLSLCEQLDNIEDDDEDALQEILRQKITTIKLPREDFGEKSLYGHAKHFLKKWGFGKYAASKPEYMLGNEDPAIVKFRRLINDACKKHYVNPRLVMNFDQVWQLLYTPESHIVWKNPKKKKNEKDDAIRKGTSKDSFRKALLQEFAPEKFQAEMDKEAVKDKWVLRFAEKDQYASHQVPENWRCPRTLTIVSWRDGKLDEAFITIPQGAISIAKLAALNKQFKGKVWVVCTDRKSHMWDSETCVLFLYRFVSRLLKLRREELGHPSGCYELHKHWRRGPSKVL